VRWSSAGDCHDRPLLSEWTPHHWSMLQHLKVIGMLDDSSASHPLFWVIYGHNNAVTLPILSLRSILFGDCPGGSTDLCHCTRHWVPFCKTSTHKKQAFGSRHLRLCSVDTHYLYGAFFPQIGVPPVIIHLYMGFSTTKTIQLWGYPPCYIHHF
jgi:hypothetical protein